MVRKTYSVVIDGEEHVIEVVEDGEDLLVSTPEEPEATRVTIDELAEALYLARMGNQQVTFGFEGGKSGQSFTLDGYVLDADVCESRFREDEIGSEAPGETGELTSITASIPGQVLEITVSEGDSLEVGDTVILLSAMKLENEIQADKRGVVEEICVEADETVEKGQTLIRIRN